MALELLVFKSFDFDGYKLSLDKFQSDDDTKIRLEFLTNELKNLMDIFKLGEIFEYLIWRTPFNYLV